MGSMRFRFDGQPINETDTPSQVREIVSSVVKNCALLCTAFNDVCRFCV